jgi:large subunit ribosomal protein L20
MARVKGSVPTRARRKKILKQAEGYFGSKHLLFKTAKEQVAPQLSRYAYVSRRNQARFPQALD